MVNRLKILSLALMTVFALSAVVSATAFGAIEVLDSVTGKKYDKGLIISGKQATTTALQILEGFAQTKCAEISIEGELITAQLGAFHFDWQKCTTSIGGTCTGLSDGVGVILALGTFHLVEDKLAAEGTLGAGILFLVNSTHYTCKTILGNTLVIVSGEVLCLVTPLTGGALAIKVKCEQGAKIGDPGETVYWNENGEKVEMGENGLLSSENGGGAKMSAEVGEAEGTLEEGGGVRAEVELMD